MQSIEVTIKGAAGDPLVLTFAPGDTADAVAERLKTLTWVVRQVSGVPDARRRSARGDREGAVAPTGTTAPGTTE
jgi:hypothetical protein